MDFWSRLTGGTHPPKKSATVPSNDPQLRLARYKRVYQSAYQICNQPGALSSPETLDQLVVCLERLASIIREETRAPSPHICLRYSAAKQVYTVIARTASVCQDERIVRGAVAVLAALIDSEEEDFLSCGPFAKSLMRFTSRVVDSAGVVVSVDTETDIIELLFGIAANIRLQPEILPVWFTSTAKPELEDVFVKEKKSFVGITQKEDFPLCYILVDRVHHEGRIGDFARTGLLYIFEATGRSLDLEEWIVSSDLPTLMASGLGALYSQLSRELNILHSDATLPAVLAMSDYSTSHLRAAAESMFSVRHTAHMATFLSYLTFWQDILNHCRSDDVKATLLDHFQILFLQQLLYPSLLQSSDTDGGSSVAVLTYLNAMLEALEHPDLVHMILSYLLAIPETKPNASPSTITPARPGMPPRSPTAHKRRQSLMLLAEANDEGERLEPTLFNLVDLVINSIQSQCEQTVFSALRLTATIIGKQRKFAFGTLIRVHELKKINLRRTVGAMEAEVEQYVNIAVGIGGQQGIDQVYSELCDDVRNALEAQTPYKPPDKVLTTAANNGDATQSYRLSSNDPLLRSLIALLHAFFTNTIDTNLALTQAIVSLATCVELQPDKWLALDPSRYTYAERAEDGREEGGQRWQYFPDDIEEAKHWRDLQSALRQPAWPAGHAPMLWKILRALQQEVDIMRHTVVGFDALLLGRRSMLHAAETCTDGVTESPSCMTTTVIGPVTYSKDHVTYRETKPTTSPVSSQGHSGASSVVSAHGRTSFKATNITSAGLSAKPAASSILGSDQSKVVSSIPSSTSGRRDVFRPPPPETPSTTDVLMHKLKFPLQAGEPAVEHGEGGEEAVKTRQREASLNHVLTNVVILHEFVLEIAAVLQTRAAVLGEREVSFA